MYYEKIPLREDQLFLLRSFDVPYMDYPLHYHPEVEITFIEQGFGRRFVGDHVGDFYDGELTMIGGYLPHQWQNDPSFLAGKGRTSLRVLHLRNPLFTQQQFDTEGFLELNTLFRAASQGIHFHRVDMSTTGRLFRALDNSRGLAAMIHLLALLKYLAEQPFQRLSSNKYDGSGSTTADRRIEVVFSMVDERLDENISAQTAANMLSMSISAFGHFFKKKTGMTFSKYLTEKRIAHACKKLTKTDHTVAEICFESGFENLSWFNRSFLRIKEMTPSAYRKRYGQDYLQSYDHHQYLHREHKSA